MSMALVFLGALVMGSSMVLYLRLYRSMNQLGDSLDSVTIALNIVYIVLMSFFMIGYLVTIPLLLNVETNTGLLIGAIFFFGAVFVLIGTIVQIRLTKVIHRENLQIIKTLVHAVEARDQNLKGHSMHVAGIVMLIYKHLPGNIRSKINAQKIEYASIMHDIGKLGIPEAILNKPAKLTDEEWAVMKEHPRIGQQILMDISGFSQITDWVLYHHERIDGMGYYRVEAENIPFVSKIICVADSYSAIVMRRSYKKSREHHEAIELMREAAGKQFDPFVFEIFENINELEVKACLPLLDQELEFHEDVKSEIPDFAIKQ